MLFRTSAMISSLLASLCGASQSEAACFGRRTCCQSTPVCIPSELRVQTQTFANQSTQYCPQYPSRSNCQVICGDVVYNPCLMTDASSSTSQAAVSLRMEKVQFEVDGVTQVVEVQIPTDSSASQTLAFRNLLLKVEEAIAGVQSNTNKNVLQDVTLGQQNTKNTQQDQTLKTHDEKLKNVPPVTEN